MWARYHSSPSAPAAREGRVGRRGGTRSARPRLGRPAAGRRTRVRPAPGQRYRRRCRGSSARSPRRPRRPGWLPMPCGPGPVWVRAAAWSAGRFAPAARRGPGQPARGRSSRTDGCCGSSRSAGRACRRREAAPGWSGWRRRPQSGTSRHPRGRRPAIRLRRGGGPRVSWCPARRTGGRRCRRLGRGRGRGRWYGACDRAP